MFRVRADICTQRSLGADGGSQWYSASLVNMRSQAQSPGLGKDNSLFKAYKFMEHSKQVELTKYSIVIFEL